MDEALFREEAERHNTVNKAERDILDSADPEQRAEIEKLLN